MSFKKVLQPYVKRDAAGKLKLFQTFKAVGQSALHDLDPRYGLGEVLYLLFEPVYLSILLLYKLAEIRVLRLQRRYLLFRCENLLAEQRRQGKVFQQIKKESHVPNHNMLQKAGKLAMAGKEEA